MRHIQKIILHCSATKEGQSFSASDIRRWHLARGFNDIGYHYVVKLDGTIEEGRPLGVIGAHTSGQNNGSIGICYIGGLDTNGKPKDTRTAQQRIALRRLVSQLRRRFPNATVHGHDEYANKACPCFNVHAESWS